MPLARRWRRRPFAAVTANDDQKTDLQVLALHAVACTCGAAALLGQVSGWSKECMGRRDGGRELL